MKEIEWVKMIAPKIEDRLVKQRPGLLVLTGKKLPYANEIRSYKNERINRSDFMGYETDLLIIESSGDGIWKPRVVVEVKIRGSISTHDAITYSHKAFTHRQVHPYLRYGILIAERKHYPLPGRLFRHGTQFDFMLSWVGSEPNETEISKTTDLLIKEFDASQAMEEFIFDSRKPGRKHYTVLHRELKVE